MSWQYRKLPNKNGYNQCFDYSTSPAVHVCGECHCAYTNIGGGITCDDCRGEHVPEEDDSFIEEMNEYGFLQTYQISGNEKTPVCPQCHAMVMPNRGEGTLCDTCKYAFDTECEHDM